MDSPLLVMLVACYGISLLLVILYFISIVEPNNYVFINKKKYIRYRFYDKISYLGA